MSIEAVLVHDGPWTEEEFLGLPEEWRRVELLDGDLLMSPNQTFRHQLVSSRLCAALAATCPSNLVAVEAINVRVGPSRILIPDLAVVRPPESDLLVLDPADVLLVAEIVSPGSVAVDRAIKPQLYAAAGIPIYVRIELAGPTSVVHRLEASGYAGGPGDPVLRLTEPFRAEVDLPVLLTSR